VKLSALTTVCPPEVTVIFMAPLPVLDGTIALIVLLVTLNTLALIDPKLTPAP
jgi:hypothetical protein